MSSKFQADWIAVDWGTSTLRVWAVAEDGTVLAQNGSQQGMNALSPSEFEPALIKIVSDWLSDGRCTLVLCCGMVGARQGWQEATYRPVPTPAIKLAHLTQAPTSDPRIDVKIIPGVSQRNPPDVMRGEETQIAGFLLRDPEFEGVVCLPGTHSKWVRISVGEIVSFTTFMTGELFDLLSRQSVLRHSMGREGWDEPSFDEGVDTANSNSSTVSAELFSIRAESMNSALPPSNAKARLSGLLIGQEIAAAKTYWSGKNVVLIGAPSLCALYQRALQSQSVQARTYFGNDVVFDGLRAVHASVMEREILCPEI